MDTLKVTSYNCNSLRKQVDLVRELMTYNDVILLQEIILTNDDLDVLSSINSEFDFSVTPSTCNLDNVSGGRPKGGLAVYWRKSLSSVIRPVLYDNNMMGVKVLQSSESLLLLNVYFPFENHSVESLNLYNDMLASVASVVLGSDSDKVIICGDFNADPYKGRFWNLLKAFAADFSFKIADQILPIDTFTYLSPFHNTTSWLDHVLVSHENLISDIHVMYDLSIEDHFPLVFEINFQSDLTLINNIVLNNSITDKQFVNWTKFSEADKQKYRDNLNNLLIQYENEVFMCKQPLCSALHHEIMIKEAYEFLCNCFKVASEEFSFNRKSVKPKIVPGWNDHCSELHRIARASFLEWKNSGKVRFGPIFERMKESRTNFKKALAYCKRNCNEIKHDKLIESFTVKNMKQFWKDVRKTKGTNMLKTNMIDNENDSSKIASLFSDKFKQIFDDHDSQVKPYNFDEDLQKYIQEQKYAVISVKNVKSAIIDLKCGIGSDDIHSNHLKYGSPSLNEFIAHLFTAMINHSYIPENMLSGEIRPIVKNKFGDIHSSENYRPVMLSSNLLKIFEYCLLPSLRKHVKLDNNQFGFRSNTSTLNAVTVFKEIVYNYTDKGSYVFSTFLDLSKAFDKVNYYILIKKMLVECVPPYLVNMIYNMYNNQKVNIGFKESKSAEWKVKNGVRQGGITSPLLFSFYINNVLQELKKLKVGCRLDIYNFNVLAYADDLVLLSPSAEGLQTLLNIICLLLSQICMKVNCKKTVCMIFAPYRKSQVSNFMFLFNDTVLPVVKQCKYLGVEITDTLCNESDILRSEKAFLTQFYCFIRKFNFCNNNILIYLFKSYCLSFYGIALWYDLKGCSQSFKSIGISYHNAIKRFLNMSNRASNHEACNACNLFVFSHFVNSNIFRYIFSLHMSRSPCLSRIKGYLIFHSRLSIRAREIANKVYGVVNLLDNDIDAILSRVNFVQSREDRLR